MHPKPSKRPVPTQSTTKYVMPPVKQVKEEEEADVVITEGALGPGEVEFATFSRPKEEGNGEEEGSVGAGGEKSVSGPRREVKESMFDLSNALDEGVDELKDRVTPNGRKQSTLM